MRVLVTGDREWADSPEMYNAFNELWYSVDLPDGHDPKTAITIIEGCQDGADREAERLTMMTFPFGLEHHPADWDRYGPAAGPIRNQEMLDSGIDLCLAFHRDLKRSKGTLDMIERVLRARVPVWLYPRT